MSANCWLHQSFVQRVLIRLRAGYGNQQLTARCHSECQLYGGSPTNHATDCNFCMTIVHGFNSVSKPLAHNPVSCPVPLPPLVYSLVEHEPDDVTPSPGDTDTDSDYKPEEEVHIIDLGELCDLVHDLALTKGQAELLGSRLKEFNLLAPSTSISKVIRERRCSQTTVGHCSEIFQTPSIKDSHQLKINPS